MVLTQTAGAGKLTTENWNQLADAIPGASGKLQEAMLKNGAYTGNFRDAMAKGEITADEFNQAIMQLGMTDAAKEAATSTTTIEGALGNLEAAAVKAGVTVLDSVKPMVTGAMNGVSDALTAVTPLIQNTIQGTIAWFRDLYGKLRDNGALTAFKSAWDTIRNAIMGVVNMVIDWVRLAPPDTLANAIKFVADALNWFLAHGNTLIPIIIGIGTAFAAVKGYQALNNGLTALTNTMNAVTKTATGVSNGILTMMDLGGPVQMIGQLAGKMKLAQTAQAAWSAATKAATAVQGAFNAVMAMTGGPITLAIAAIAAIVAALSWFFTQTETGRQAWGAFTSWLSQTWTTLVEGAKTLWQGLSDFFTGLWETISATAQTAWNTISSVVTPIVQAIGEFIKNVFIVLAAVLVTVWNGISNVVTTVWNAIRSFLEPLVQGIADFITNAVNAISSVWNSVWNSISSFFATVWNAMVAFYTPIINGIRNTIGNVVNAIRGTWNSVWSGISGFFSNIWNGMRNAVSNAVNAIGGTVGRIWGIVTGALGGAGNWLYDTGRQIIQGLINGIGGAFQWVKNTISNLGRSVVSWAKSVLHIGSPSRVFADEVGKWIPAGMAQGITENTGVVQKGIDKLTDMVPSIHVATEFDDPDALQYAQINGGFDVSASRSGRANVGNGGGSTTYVTQTFNYPAIAPTSISTQQRLQTAAMPQW